VRPENVLFVDDLDENVVGAWNAGFLRIISHRSINFGEN